MTELIRAHCSAGRISVTETHLVIRLAGVSERSIARTAITGVSIGLSAWYGIGFFRSLSFFIQGQSRPIKVGGMRKSKAQQIKALLEEKG